MSSTNTCAVYNISPILFLCTMYYTYYIYYVIHSLAGFQKIPTCEDRHGWTYIDKWLNNIHVHIKSKTNNKHSNIKCIIDYKTSYFCQYKQIILDFSKILVGFSNRNFLTGFFNIYRTIGDTYYKPIDMRYLLLVMMTYIT